MLDPRITQLAELFCGHAVRLDASDRLLIHAFDIPDEAVAEFVRIARSKGSQVMLRLESSVIRRELMLGMTAENARTIADVELHEMKQATAYIALRGGSNYAEMSEVSSETMAMWSKEYSTPVVFGQRVPHSKWAVTRWPSPGMAQQAGMSTKAFEDFFFKVCCLDYAKMSVASKPLEDLMNRTDRVEIKGPGTNLSFSIKGVGAVACCGEANIPDGECFTAPVRESMNGEITYNTVSLYQGTEFKDIYYRVVNGRIEEARAGSQTDKLNQILDTDEGARYFGEWALGFNPHVLEPMKDTLFDEKIAGSFHLTPGNAYDPPGGNGNKSAIHWDTVLIQRPEYGGGEIWFDGVLVRKDGLFVLPELQGLNPEHLG
ncbi:MAG: aminopeptidase [Armatimonadetes bacterium]|nr:aminopeptidase [Armatimonadota bacterium]